MSLVDAFEPRRFVVVNLGLTHEAVGNGVTVEWRPRFSLGLPFRRVGGSSDEALAAP